MGNINDAVDRGRKEIEELEPLYQTNCTWFFRCMKDILRAMREETIEGETEIDVQQQIRNINKRLDDLERWKRCNYDKHSTAHCKNFYHKDDKPTHIYSTTDFEIKNGSDDTVRIRRSDIIAYLERTTWCGKTSAQNDFEEKLRRALNQKG